MEREQIEGQDTTEALLYVATFWKNEGLLEEAEKLCSQLLDYGGKVSHGMVSDGGNSNTCETEKEVLEAQLLVSPLGTTQLWPLKCVKPKKKKKKKNRMFVVSSTN